MISISNEAKCTAIGSKLADMKVLQMLLVSEAETLRCQCPDSSVDERFRRVKKNEESILAMLDGAIARLSNQCSPSANTLDLVAKTQQMLRSDERSLADKALQYSLLKYQQIFTGLMLHEAAAAIGGATASAMKPLNGFSFELEIHQEDLKAILEILAVRELAGKAPSHGFLHLLQDSWTGW